MQDICAYALNDAGSQGTIYHVSLPLHSYICAWLVRSRCSRFPNNGTTTAFRSVAPRQWYLSSHMPDWRACIPYQENPSTDVRLGWAGSTSPQPSARVPPSHGSLCPIFRHLASSGGCAEERTEKLFWISVPTFAKVSDTASHNTATSTMIRLNRFSEGHCEGWFDIRAV